MNDLRTFVSRHAAALLIGTGFVLVAFFAYNRGGTEASVWTPVEEVAPPAPSAENVDPNFHARLMTLRDRLATAPDDTTTLLEAARLEQDAHQLDAAAEHYERLLAIAPRTHQVWLDLANVYAGLGRWDDARRASERMLERYPGDPSALYNLGAIAANQGDRAEAERHWTAVRDGDDGELAAQAEASLSQLGAFSAQPSPRRSTAARPNPHTTLGQPVVAHPVSSIDGE